MKHEIIFPLIALAAACAVAPESYAQLPNQEGAFKRSDRVWKLRDTCARNSQKQFPDHTAEGNAKRERAFQQCLEANNLPYESSTSKDSTSPSHR
jgi:hypothetical protein